MSDESGNASAIPIPEREEFSRNASVHERTTASAEPRRNDSLNNTFLWSERLPAAQAASHYRKSIDYASGPGTKQGVVMGVFFPCAANILGVLLFLRLPWIVGRAGIGHSLLLVFICCLCTFLTSLSLSAIATNGKVLAGGSYFLISRSLGPSIGAAVGICFYVGNSVAAALYVLGTVEAWATANDNLLIFPSRSFNNLRVLGLIVLVLCVFTVAVGLKWVARASTLFLMVVLVVIMLMCLGCFIGPTSFTPTSITAEDQSGNIISINVAKHFSGPSWANVVDNWGPAYDQPQNAFPFAVKSNFITTTALWFPACTGIMAGSNRSANLAAPQKSIPLGTLVAQISTSFIYLSFCLIFGCTSTRYLLLNDKFFAATIAFPHFKVVQYGVMASTIGASFQCLISAPRLLSAIAGDGTISFLQPFHAPNGAEPRWALALTLFICACCIAIGNMNYVAPIITMFFLLCYLFVNLACFLLSILHTPGWRPIFRFYHWTSAMVGMMLCLGLMFAIDYIYCIVAFFLAVLLVRYVSCNNQSLNWGDGVQGVKFQWARAFLREISSDQHTKNWRPQVLALVELTPNVDGSDSLEIIDKQFIHFVSQLKHGKGLTIIGGLVIKDITQIKPLLIQNWYAKINRDLKKMNIVGFAKILCTTNHTEGIFNLIQTAGLGGFEPNCVMASWPADWTINPEAKEFLIKTIHVCTTLQKSVFLLKTNILDDEPMSLCETTKLTGTIDIWWLVADGGLLLLLPFLLQKHKKWNSCTLRLFTVVNSAMPPDELEQTKQELTDYINDHRLPIQVILYPLTSYYDFFLLISTDIASPDDDLPANDDDADLDFTSIVVVENKNNDNHDNNCTNANADGKKYHLEVNHKNITNSSNDNTPSYCSWNDNSDSKISPPAASSKCLSSSYYSKRFSRYISRFIKKRHSLNSESLDNWKNRLNCPSSFQFPKKPEIRGFDSFALPTDRMESDSPCGPRILNVAKTLNAAILEMSSKAALVVTNLPDVPLNHTAFAYMQFVEAMSESIKRMLLVRGSSTEVITAFT